MKNVEDIIKHFWKIIISLGIFIALMGGLWTIDSRYVIRDIFTKAQAEDQKARQNIQVQFMESRALDRLFYWQKILVDLEFMRINLPKDLIILQNIKEARSQIEKIQKELEELNKLR